MFLIACLFATFVIAVTQVSAGDMEDEYSAPDMETGEEIEDPSEDYDSEDEDSEESGEDGTTGEESESYQ